MNCDLYIPSIVRIEDTGEGFVIPRQLQCIRVPVRSGFDSPHLVSINSIRLASVRRLNGNGTWDRQTYMWKDKY